MSSLNGARPARLRGTRQAWADRPDTGCVRVLLVDDEERMVAALRRGLTAEGFVGRERAGRRDRSGPGPQGDFDAMVLDVMLPGLSGYEVVRRLRAEDNWVPVLMLSAKDGEYDQADALRRRRRRLPDQAVLLRGPAGPDPGAAAPRGGGPAGGADGRRHQPGPGEPGGPGRRDAGRADPARVRPAGVPDPQRRPGGGEDRADRPRLGQRRRRHANTVEVYAGLPAAQDRHRAAAAPYAGSATGSVS